MLVYMDGGHQTHEHNKRLCMLSWGIVVHHNDTTVELHGCKTHMPEHFKGCHERLAFVEATKHVQSQGVSAENVSFVTDDATVCDYNLAFLRTEKVDKTHVTYERLARLCRELYDQATFDFMLECLTKSRFTKVKGHHKTVYNLRCDDLSSYARRVAKGDLTPMQSFEDWLHDGFHYYDKTQQVQRWYAPFSNMHPELLAA